MARVAKLRAGEPVPRSEFYILIALAAREQHGYEIMRYVKLASQDKVRLSPGTLYVAIKRLLDDGLIAEAGKRVEKDRRLRKYYRLTGKGKKILGAELTSLDSLLSLPNVRKLIPAV